MTKIMTGVWDEGGKYKIVVVSHKLYCHYGTGNFYPHGSLRTALANGWRYKSVLVGALL